MRAAGTVGRLRGGRTRPLGGGFRLGAGEHAAVCDVYDDEQDHQRCTDCKGTGWYVGFTDRRYCPTCDGSGFL